MLCELGMIREASSCMDAAGCWYSTIECYRDIYCFEDEGNYDDKMMMNRSFSYISGMCQAASSCLLYTSRDIATASAGMIAAAQSFIYAKDVQRASYCVNVLQDWWVKNAKTKGETKRTNETKGRDTFESQIKETNVQVQNLQNSTNNSSARVGTWYFLVSFNGEGFQSYDPLLVSGTSFVYTIHAPYVADIHNFNGILQKAKDMALSLQEHLENAYYVFENGMDSISVLPAVEMYESLNNTSYSASQSPIEQHFMTLEINDQAVATKHVYEVSDPVVPFVTRFAVRPVGLGDTSNEERLQMWIRKAIEAPCLSSSWSCLDWSQKLCQKEPIVTGNENENQNKVENNSVDTPFVNPLSFMHDNSNQDSKYDGKTTENKRQTNETKMQATSRPAKPKEIREQESIIGGDLDEVPPITAATTTTKPKPISKPKKSNLAALRRERKPDDKKLSFGSSWLAKKNKKKLTKASEKKKIKKTPPPPQEAEAQVKVSLPPSSSSIPAAKTAPVAPFEIENNEDVPAWMLGMQEQLSGGGGGSGGDTDTSSTQPVRRTSIAKASVDTKEAMAYARSLGAFMSPADAKQLMHSVKVDQKVVVDCVVTTNKGGKDAKVEITPNGVKIYARSTGMFKKTKILYTFALTKSLSAREAPTPKILMLMAPELNGEMLYLNCEKRGVFKGSIAAFLKQKEEEEAAAAGGGVEEDSGGGGDGWGSSGW